ncbi:MAG: EAL domain-containing protein [Pikeienuella sp.]
MLDIVETKQKNVTFATRKEVLEHASQPNGCLVIAAPYRLDVVNNLEGWEAGDAILAQLNRTLIRSTETQASVARVGARFIMAMHAAEQEAAQELVGCLFDRMAALAPELRFHLGAAWGTVKRQPDTSFLSALKALDTARGNGPTGFHVLEHDVVPLDGVLARDALCLIRAGLASIALQPVVDASAPGRVLFKEALIRLSQPNGRIATAGAFMPALTRLGLAVEADRVALELALDELAMDPSLRLSVNASEEALSDPNWRTLIEHAPFEVAERLIIELSEEAELCTAPRIRTLAALRRRGVALALDDFGAGRTSFSQLRDIRFDMVKIDGGFIRDVENSPDNQALVKALVGIARQFDMTVVAEFVETAEQARVLRRLEVDGFQGYLFGEPMLVWADGEYIRRSQG